MAIAISMTAVVIPAIILYCCCVMSGTSHSRRVTNMLNSGIEEIKNIEYRTLISVEKSETGDKYIHYLGFGYHVGEPSSSPYRWVEYTFFIEPLADVLKYGIGDFENDHQEGIKQYIYDMSDIEIADILNEDYEAINEEDISELTPCGTYWLIYKRADR